MRKWEGQILRFRRTNALVKTAHFRVINYKSAIKRKDNKFMLTAVVF